MSLNNHQGVLTSGSAAKTFLSRNLIVGNVVGLAASSSGQNISLCGNTIGGNFTDGSPTSSISAGCT